MKISRFEMNKQQISFEGNFSLFLKQINAPEDRIKKVSNIYFSAIDKIKLDCKYCSLVFSSLGFISCSHEIISSI